MGYVTNKGKKYKKYKRMSKEEIELIFKLYNEKMELRKIARVVGRSLSSVQYQLKKNDKNI
jgi:IS30 family transposase